VRNRQQARLTASSASHTPAQRRRVCSAEKLLRGVDLSKKLNVLMGTCAALAHMHSKDFIHRDVALRNVLVRADFHPLLADFGLACSVDSGTGAITEPFSYPIYTSAPVCLRARPARMRIQRGVCACDDMSLRRVRRRLCVTTQRQRRATFT
jgi:serine/threonine protein kinase